MKVRISFHDPPRRRASTESTESWPLNRSHWAFPMSGRSPDVKKTQVLVRKRGERVGITQRVVFVTRDSFGPLISNLLSLVFTK